MKWKVVGACSPSGSYGRVAKETVSYCVVLQFNENACEEKEGMINFV